MNFKKFGKYTIIKKLASGGMADILLACELSPTGFGRFVALKRALSKFSENKEFTEMFKNEGKVACNLKHRNITPIYEFGIEKNQFFLSMEYISGKNLRELIKKLKTYKFSVSISNSVHIIKEIASGLNYAHNAIDSNTGSPLNLIHRDVSPQNIMLSFDGEIKLIDFGIAKIVDTHLTRAGHLKGKFSYMSPEQAHGEILDERTDIFCLGIILWELLTGKRLFASQNELASLKKIKNCNIPNAQTINPKIPTELNNIVKKALSKNKHSRYKTAAKLEQDLSVFLNKNYPEYSHYDFISLMKTTYKREIMEEREKLKIYSSEFKKYLNSLNIEESPQTQIDLSIPDLSTLAEGRPETKSLPSQQGHSLTLEAPSASYPASHLSTEMTNEGLSLAPASQVVEEKSSTLIQKRERDTTVEKNTKSVKNETAKTSPVKQDPSLTKEGSLALNLRYNTQLTAKPTDYFKEGTLSQQSFQRSKLYSAKDIFYSESLSHKSQNKKKAPFALFLIIPALLAAFSFTAYWLIKSDQNIKSGTSPSLTQPVKHTHKALSSAPATAEMEGRHPSSAHKSPAPRHRKILISSKPSGAAIFINNQFSSKYTPSLITLTVRQNTHIKLKKEGYLIKNIIFDPKKQRRSSLNIPLTVNQKDMPSDTIHFIQ